MSLAKMGIEAVMDVAGFQRGAKAYDSQLAKSSSATTKAAGQFDKDLTKIQTKSASVFGSMAKIAGGILGAQVIGKALSAVKGFATGAIAAGADATEMISKFGVTFGKETDKMTASLTEFGKATGRSKYDLMTMAADFGAVTKAIGFNEKASADLSLEMAQLAVDVGSFMNVQSPEVMARFRSALTGETESLKTLGIVINQEMIKQEALNAGLWDGVGVLKQEAKAMAVRNLLMKMTTDAQGDAARTADSWANQTVKLKATWKDFQTRLGLGLTQGLGPVLQVIGQIAGNALPKFAEILETKIIPIIGEFATKISGLITTFSEGGLGAVIEELFGADIGGKVNAIVGAISTIGGALQSFGQGDIMGGMGFLSEAVYSIADAFGLAEGPVDTFVDVLWQVIGTIATVVEKIGEFVAANPTAVIAGVAAVLAAILVPAFVSWAVAAGAAALATLAAIAPLLAIGAAVALLVVAWQTDWGGIQTFITTLWTSTLQPIFAIMVEWLQVNIPLALATLSAFWTNTLLPAIQAVWQFIQGSVVPLLQALASVTIAALSLSLTALSGLWQNVLLPAITAVAGFITGSAVPAIQEIVGWLGEKLAPVIERVTGWFSKASTSLGGLSGAISKAVGWIQGLADKLNALKLPAWLTPGSPTPMEMGLRGIASALGPVVDEMLAFAKSMSGPQAAAMKNVASAFKDMAKGIDEMAGALLKIGEFQGTGGSIGGFGTWLDQFAEVAIMAASKIETIIEVIGYNRIHKLKLTAGRLNEVIAAVLVDLSAIKARTFPDLTVWFNQLQDIFQRAVVVMNAIYGKWGMAVLTRAAEVAGLVGQVLQILGEDLGKAVPPPPDYESILDAFLGGLEMAMNKIMPKLSDIWAFFGGPVLNEAVKTVAAISEIVGILSLSSVLEGVVKAKTALEQDFGPLLDLVMVALRVAVDAIVPMLLDVQERWGEALEAVDGVAGKMDEVLGVLGVDLAKIIPPPVNFPALLGGFLAALVMGVNALVPMLRDVRAQIGGTVIDEAALTAKALADIIGILSLADVFAGLSKPENAIKNNFTKMVQKVLDALTSAVDILIPGLQSINAKWGGVLEEVVKIAQSMASVFGGINDAQTAALEFSKSGNLDLGAFTRKIATLNAATAAAVAGLVAPAIPAPAIVGAAPGTTPVSSKSGAVGGNVNVSTGPVVVNIYGAGGNLLQTYTQSTNAAGQVDIRLAEGMSTG